VVPRPPTPRYTYLSPAKPRPGDRQAAEPFFAQGLKAHGAKRLDDALLAFRAALDKDPAYYEAYYNVALLAMQGSDWRAALQACEIALAIQPTDVPARLALAHALDQSGYYLDAQSELEKVLGTKPDEVRAHLALANLLAQKFQLPDRARPHYEKVLELDPHHPRANEIRYWLSSNP
jgi:tetratricopeptide (TPR) repeat protein